MAVGRDIFFWPGRLYIRLYVGRGENNLRACRRGKFVGNIFLIYVQTFTKGRQLKNLRNSKRVPQIFLPSPRKNAGKSKDSPRLRRKLPIDKKYMIRGKMMIAIKRFYKGDIDKTVICFYLSFKTSTMIHSFIEFVK